MKFIILVLFLFVTVVASAFGIYYGVLSAQVPFTSGVHVAMLACACFLFGILLGVWVKPIQELFQS